jgi:hypothetical protein
MKSIKAKILISVGTVVVIFSILLLYRSYTLTNSSLDRLIQQQVALALNFDLATREYVAAR